MKCPGCGSNMKVRAKSVFDNSTDLLVLSRSSRTNDSVSLNLYCPKQYDKSDPCQVDGSYVVEVSGFREWIKEGARRTVDVRIEDSEAYFRKFAEVKELRGLLQAVLDNADEADLDNEVYLDSEIINRIKEVIA